MSLRNNQPKTALNRLFLAFCALSVCCLAFPLIAEIWWGLKPCKLCLIQRYVYLGTALLGILGLILPYKSLFRQTLLLLFALGTYTALYQSFAHFGLIETKCITQNAQGQEITDFKSMIYQPANCNEQTLEFLGIPASVINSLIYLSCFAGLLLQGKLRAAKSSRQMPSSRITKNR